ncbi:MAG: CubicO group peptidase (beta-lactamase class C family) [Arenicella sp.]|jgi:CubicO group peptidase (beta-lactamase class C family)
MRILKKIFKWFSITVLTLIVIVNLAIIFTGRFYTYKGIYHTYMKGHIRPHIYDLNVFNNAMVDAGNPQPWENMMIPEVKLTEEERTRIEAIEPASFLVAYGDSVIFEEYWNEHDQERIGNSFSMAKSVVSLLIGCALDEGKIKSLDDPVADYLEEFKGDKSKITIRHVLTMTTGLSWSESYVHPFCDVAELYYDTDDRDLSCNRREVEEEPGNVWGYKSGDTQVLTYILKEATGVSVSEYAADKLWIPMGAESEAMWSLSDEIGSTEKGFCCFYATSRDFIRLGKLVNNRGNWNGEQLVSKTYVDEFCSLAPITKPNGKPNNCYGFQYWIYTGFPYEVTYFRGMSGQYIISLPEQNLVVVRTGNGVEESVLEATSAEDALENHRRDMPFYVETGLRLLAEFKKQ